jgi:hypothetical protein
MVFEPRLGTLRLRLAGFERRLRLKAQPIEPEESVHKISLEIPVIQYLPLFLKFYYRIQKLSLIIHCNTCDALFIYRVSHLSL